MFDCNPFQKLDKYDSESLLSYEIFLSGFNHKIKPLWINTLEQTCAFQNYFKSTSAI